MSTLSGRQAKELSEGLRDAFLADALDEFLYFVLDKRREDITLASDYRSRVFRLIRTADSEGWVLRLIGAAREARPGHAPLQAVAAELGLGTAPPSLERIILPSVPFVDASTWRAQLGELEAQVCRVEIPAGLQATVGTGFLVAPDLCLTNFHVVKPLIDQLADPSQVRLRFDYKRAMDGTVVSEGTLFTLAQEWFVAARPPSTVDNLADPGNQLPSLDELDFALLRVHEDPGEQAIGRADGLSDAPKRGWVHRIGTAGLEKDHPLFVLEHPEGAPLKLAFGPSVGLNANASRLRHQVNTEAGSSGSPCMNAKLELVALHHAGDPNYDPAHKPAYNSAIPIAAIRGYLNDAGVQATLFPPVR
jgi:Trypsin-like peptidase domain/Effector-associated domain 1